MFFYEECHTSICVVTIDLKNKFLLVGQSEKNSAEKKSAGKKSIYVRNHTSLFVICSKVRKSVK